MIYLLGWVVEQITQILYSFMAFFRIHNGQWAYQELCSCILKWAYSSIPLETICRPTNGMILFTSIQEIFIDSEMLFLKEQGIFVDSKMLF